MPNILSGEIVLNVPLLEAQEYALQIFYHSNYLKTPEK